MGKDPREMKDRELLKAWNKGKVWMMATSDNGKTWRRGLWRMEALENEMQKRKVGPWA